jgi:hypothetical protein
MAVEMRDDVDEFTPSYWVVPQQHHLDALALRRWYLPTRRSS